ncbi:MAG: dihydroorotate dehydrogenase electron transfer subunit, partial [Bacteroidales bacterium]|nr:dihydroorotate dehydrogenase electron transfer subunit [Bacteroidales bacterium]
PFAAMQWDADGFDLIYKVVGQGTDVLSRLEPGACLDVLTGLGNGFDASECRNAALVVCGGLGASPAFSLVKELVAGGRKVCVILGFNSASDVILLDEYKGIGADVRVVTMDGSAGLKGLVTDAIDALRPEFDYFYTCGPKVMMKAVCSKLDAPGEASLEERMGCGCGICYGCTCRTTSGPRRVCADGPVFKKEEIVW